ncbi:MAG TPA: hypothetical protein VF231_09950 [Candidatus Limnocylindrales bacterium]
MSDRPTPLSAPSAPAPPPPPTTTATTTHRARSRVATAIDWLSARPSWRFGAAALGSAAFFGLLYWGFVLSRPGQRL